MNRIYDIAVVGSGFAGSLMAMIAHRMGRSVVLLERGKHPRMAIGESSTPLSNLLLEDLTVRYNLPQIRPLTKWGTWQHNYNHIGCGLKRGFTFYHHRLGQPDAIDPDHLHQLLVAASPHNAIADTHWYRADFDAMLVHEAQTLGVDYFDEVKLERCIDQGGALSLEGKRGGSEAAFHARFVIDATGPRGFLHRALHLPEAALPNYPSTQALYSHFSGVERLGSACAEPAPYPVDSAAVHHVFDGGWVWVLHFNNGITSAGVAATAQVSQRLHLSDRESAWRRLLVLMPTLNEQFKSAKAEQPFNFVPQLSFMTGEVAGEKWTMLPSAAGFIDPLLSTGFPLTLLGVGRIAAILEQDWGTPRLQSRLRQYGEQTKQELLVTSRLIASLYANMNNFPVFTALSLLYFAAASFSEAARRLERPHLAPSFLLHDHPVFGPACRRIFERAQCSQAKQESIELIDEVYRAIEPIDVAGLSNRQRRNWYPVAAEDLLRSASKLGATREEIQEMLERCSFYQ